MVTAEQFVTSQKQKHPGVVLTLQEQGEHMVVENLVIPALLRRTGIGSEVMEALVTAADKEQWFLTLTPDSVYGTPVHVLELFYRKFGFVKASAQQTPLRLVRSPQRLTERFVAAEQTSRTD